MKGTRLTVLAIFAAIMLTGCNFIKNTFTYKDKTKELVEVLIKEDYQKAVSFFAMEHEIAKNTNLDTMKMGLANFREFIVKNFGTNLNYKFMRAEKKWSTEQENNTPPNTTVAYVEFSNTNEFGVFKVIFDDNSGKILNINALDIRRPIPNMTLFWLFGLVAICVPVFNIYMIRQIKRSDLQKKWLKYLAIAVLNVPALTFAAVEGFSFKLLNFQILLGISFSYMGYLSSAWTFGLPLGGLYWFWKLKKRKNESAETPKDQDPETE